jgi:hypothetical protein
MVFFSCFAQDGNQEKIAVMVFDTHVINIGETKYVKDSTYFYSFVFHNEGTAPLQISKVIAACPCVTLSYPHEPLQPGQKDSVLVYFTPNHASRYTQRITVLNNSDRPMLQLYAKGTFLKASEWKARQQAKAKE